MSPEVPEAGASAECPHCGAAVEGAEDRFCCFGCEMAWKLVHDAGLEEYYERREEAGMRPEARARSWDAVQVHPVGDHVEVTLAIDGLRCTSCTWVVEKVLERTEGVQDVHVSYASGRARVAWDPEVIDLTKLAQRVSALGYSPRPVQEASPPEPLFSNLGVALFATSNLMLLTAGLYASWIDGMEPRFQALFRWLSLVLATPVAIYSAAPFWRGAWAGVLARKIGMDVPIALAVGVLYGHGVIQTLRGGDAYLDSLGMLVSLLLIGRIVESRGRRKTADAAAAIAAELPAMARRRTSTGVEEVDRSLLALGDTVELGPGTEVPADAKILEGAFKVQMALLTGESIPRAMTVGETLYAGSVIETGSGAAEVIGVGQDTMAMQMVTAVRDAIDRPTAKNAADALAPSFTLATIGVAAISASIWTWVSGLEMGLQVGVAVLVVACPCALGLSVPLAVSAGLGALSRRGVLLRDGDTLLRLAEVETVALDKTGTLTHGSLTVVAAEDPVLRICAGLERASQHPIGRAITREAVERGIPLPLFTHVVETPGQGIEGDLEGHHYVLQSGGAGRVRLTEAGQEIGVVELGDRLRPDVLRSVELLRGAGLKLAILSGDVSAATHKLAEEVGIHTEYGELLPEQKVSWVQEHSPALFVGDGLNDGPALANAHVGLAMRTGAGSSLGAADGVVSADGLRPIVAAIAGARATQSAIRTNLRRSVVYNLIAVAGAAFGFVNPLVAAVLMPLSSGMVLYGAWTVDRRLEQEERKWMSS